MNDINMAARIAELEAENDRLKKALYKEPIDKPPFPRLLSEKYPSVFGFSSSFDEIKTRISYVVRRVCFRRKTTPRKHTSRYTGPVGVIRDTDVVIRSSEMTDEEYAKYLKILEEIAAILEANAYKEA